MKTKKIFLFILSISLLLIASNLSAQTIAVVLKVKGSVALTRGNQASQQKIRRGYRLKDGDKIVTGKKSFAAVRFIDDASLLRIRSNSTCRIQGKKEKNQVFKNVYLEVGTIFARVTKQKGRFEIATPTSVASVKGTEWITEQSSRDGITRYYGRLGVVEVSNDAGAALLRAGETVEVKDSKTAPVTRKSLPGEGQLEDLEGEEDDFEFEFENDAGEKKLLKFRVRVEQ